MSAHRLTLQALAVCLALAAGACARERVLRLTDATLGDSALTLNRCFELAHGHNAELRRAAAAVVATYGEKIRSRGRFLPRVDLLYHRVDNEIDTTDTTARGESVDVVVRQRVAEFGRTSDQEKARQDRERAARIDKENTLVRVLSDVRRTFLTLLLTQRQLAAHDSLLAHYAERMTQSADRLEKGVGLRTAVLTARLNWLDERERILRLGSNRRATLAQLKMVLGVANIPDNLALVEPPTDSLPDQDSCVARALDCSTEILEFKGELLQAGRDLGQTGWEFVLDGITFSASMAKGGRSAGLELAPGDTGERAWVLDAVGRRKLADNDGDLFPSKDTSLKVALNLEVSIPVFRGAGRHGAVIEMGARYSEARAALIGKTRDVEKRTRETFYAWQMSKELLVIQTERVAIARESYSLAETQRELGRTTDEGLEAFRKDLFGAQDAFFALQFEVESKEEDLRAMVRLLE